MSFWHFSSHGATSGPALHGEYGLGLVVLSVLIAILAALAALSVVGRLRLVSTAKAKAAWLAAGSLATGSGIWAMHFTGMQAFSLDAEVHFLLFPTLVSFVPAVLGSLVALHTLSSTRMSTRSMLLSAGAFAMAISAMHFIGMEAMYVSGATMNHDLGMFVFSIVVAYVLALAALYVQFVMEDSASGATRVPQAWVHPIAAVVMGLAVAGMHYTGMASAHFFADPDAVLPDAAFFATRSMAVVIVAICAAIAAFTMGAVAVDRKLDEAARAIREGDLRHNTVVAHVRDGLIVVSETGHIQSANPAAAAIFGYEQHELLDEPIGKILPIDHSAIASYVDMRRDIAGLHREGGNVALQISGHAIRVGRKHATTLIVRPRDEVEALERRLRRLVAAVEYTDEAILIMDADLRVVYGNPGFERTFASTARNSIGCDVSVALGIGVDSEAYCRIKEALARSMVWQGRLALPCRDGSVRQVDMSVSPVRNDINLVTNFVAFLRDVTSKLAVEQQLQQAQRFESIGQLAADVANEIDTPARLAAGNIRSLSASFSSLLQVLHSYRASLDTEAGVRKNEALSSTHVSLVCKEIPRVLAEAEQNLEHIAGMLNAMKKVANPSADKFEPSDVNATLHSAVTVSRSRWKNDADVELDLADGLPNVMCFVTELNQVFLHLLLNAVDSVVRRESNECKGRIVIVSRLQGDSIEISFRDNGAGIRENLEPRMFEAGSPLASARDIVTRNYGGSLTFESLPGVATTFRVRIPTQRPAPAARRA